MGCSDLEAARSGSAEQGPGWSWLGWELAGGMRGAAQGAWRAEEDAGVGNAAAFESAESVVVLGTGVGTEVETGVGTGVVSAGRMAVWVLACIESGIDVVEGVSSAVGAAPDAWAPGEVEAEQRFLAAFEVEVGLEFWTGIESAVGFWLGVEFEAGSWTGVQAEFG